MASVDKVALVTGGARGIGARTAEELVAHGAHVLIGDRDREGGQRTADELGEHAAFQELDVADAGSCAQVVAACVERFGSLDWLVNTAVVMDAAPLVELEAEAWRRVVDVGLTGTFLINQAVGQWLISQGRPGAIVNLASNAGLHPYGGSGAYSSVKAGILMLSKQLALEWSGNQIRVNSVSPGHIHTPLTAYLADPEIHRARSEATPLGRVGETEDVSGVIRFLLSDDASYMTASNVVVDGGVTESIFNHLAGRRWDG